MHLNRLKRCYTEDTGGDRSKLQEESSVRDIGSQELSKVSRPVPINESTPKTQSSRIPVTEENERMSIEINNMAGGIESIQQAEVSMKETGDQLDATFAPNPYLKKQGKVLVTERVERPKRLRRQETNARLISMLASKPRESPVVPESIGSPELELGLFNNEEDLNNLSGALPNLELNEEELGSAMSQTDDC